MLMNADADADVAANPAGLAAQSIPNRFLVPALTPAIPALPPPTTKTSTS